MFGLVVDIMIFLCHLRNSRFFEISDCNTTCNLLMCLQVGQWDYSNRQRFLQDNYSFKCECSGCTKVNLPDLVLNAFRCAKLNCSGVVLDDCMVEHQKHKFCHLQETPEIHSMEHQREVCIRTIKPWNTICCLFE